MFPSDKLRKLEELAGKLDKSKIFLGSYWAKSRETQNRNSEPGREIIRLEETVNGENIELPAGTYYRIRKNLTAVWPEAASIVQLYKKVMFGAGQLLDLKCAGHELNALTAATPPCVTYLDIETCGFSGTSIFLIGWCYFDGENDFVIEQALARDYTQEAGILAAAAERLSATQVLVTYNGKRFDLPSIMERAIIHRVDVPQAPTHLDMLLEARKRWKRHLPNCQLQTVELFLCRRARRGDIDGADIPQVYHDFVKNLDARKLKHVIHHNFLDVVTLAEITIRLLAGEEPEV
ncbi:MAG: ribonuclease H-like domain-containing protein [Phycisphaerae bacterium]